MAQEKRYLGESGLQTLVDLIKAGYAKMVHSHTLSEITDYTVDSEIKSDSENPVQNQVVKEALDLRVPVVRTVNGKTLEADINLSASDVGTMTSEEITIELDTKADAIGVAYIDIEDNENVEYEGTITGSTIELVDRLNSTSTTSALTANQGKVLKGYIDELNEDVETLNSNKADKDVVDGLYSSINELNEGLESCFQSVSDGKNLIASAITDKNVPTDATDTFETMANNIASLKLGSGDALPEDVVKDKTFTNDDGVEYTGTLEFSGDAATGNVLSGKTFYNNDPKTKVTGTMPDQGAKTASLNCGASYTIPAGYHNGSGKITANSLKSQTSATAAAAQITKGYTAWVNGVKITGTRVAPVTKNSGTFSMTYVDPAGEHRDFTVNFSNPFDSTNYAINFEVVSGAYITWIAFKVISKQRSYCVVRLTNSHPSGSASGNVSWVAEL